MDMPTATVLDRFSHIFGDRRGLPKALCERRRVENLRRAGSLIEVLTGGKLSPGESLLVAGGRGSQGHLCNQILSDFIDQGESCLLVSPTPIEASIASNQVMDLTSSRAGELLSLLIIEGDEKALMASLLGEIGAHPVVCVDTLDALATRTGDLSVVTFSRLLEESRKWGTNLIIVKRTKPTFRPSWRQQLELEGLLSLADHAGAITEEPTGVLSWDGGRWEDQSEVTPLYFDTQTHVVST